MTSMNTYKEAVLRRAEQKRIARRRARNRCLAVCVPLCVALTLTAFAVGGRILPTPPLKEESSDLCGAVGSTGTAVEIYTAYSTVQINDTAHAATLYSTLSCWMNPPEIADGGTNDYTNGSLSEEVQTQTKITQSGVVESEQDEFFGDGSLSLGDVTEDYRICFTDGSGNTVTFTLNGYTLTDTQSGESVILSEEQYTLLMSLLEEGTE